MKRLFVDLDICIGCGSHSTACFRVNKDRAALISSDVDRIGTFPVVCRHCDNPACLESCPKEAIYKDDNGVVHRSDLKCVGCRNCINACPFGVITQDMIKGAMTKCNLCFERTEKGLLPACVATCPSGALQYEEVEKVSKRKEVLGIGGREFGHNPYMRRP